MEADPTSDLLAIYRLQKEWRLYDTYADKLDFCNDKNLSYRYVKFSEGKLQCLYVVFKHFSNTLLYLPYVCLFVKRIR